MLNGSRPADCKKCLNGAAALTILCTVQIYINVLLVLFLSCRLLQHLWPPSRLPCAHFILAGSSGHITGKTSVRKPSNMKYKWDEWPEVLVKIQAFHHITCKNLCGNCQRMHKVQTDIDALITRCTDDGHNPHLFKSEKAM